MEGERQVTKRQKTADESPRKFMADAIILAMSFESALRLKPSSVKEMCQTYPEVAYSNNFPYELSLLHYIVKVPMANFQKNRRVFYELIEYVISKGVNINCKSKNNESTPLHQAAHAGNTEMVEFLVARGAHIHNKTSGGYLPLHNAVLRQQTEVMHVLLVMHKKYNPKIQNEEIKISDKNINKFIPTLKDAFDKLVLK
eukprot:Phypoly_transcript_04872.p1 GENE.Phypoly_transcript_04872~~Phypoly_transcript_04872.p1  ORF type:complete len:199 (+),score=30.58 Phypoly_transcript_04872:1311-1907(+)